MKSRRKNSLLKQFVQLFLIYLFVIPAVFAILDWKLFSRYFEKDAGLMLLCITGVAAIIALLWSLWSRHERRMHSW